MHYIRAHINRDDFEKAKAYTPIFLSLFVSDEMYHNCRKIMPCLNIPLQTFLTFYLFDQSMRSGFADLQEGWSVKGGFIRAIHDGYGEYIFERPFSSGLAALGAERISAIVEKSRLLTKIIHSPVM